MTTREDRREYYARRALEDGIQCPRYYEVSSVEEVHLITRIRLDLRKAEIDKYCQNIKEERVRYLRGEDGAMDWGDPSPKQYEELILNSTICPKCARGSHYGVWFDFSFHQLKPNFPKPKTLRELEALR